MRARGARRGGAKPKRPGFLWRWVRTVDELDSLEVHISVSHLVVRNGVDELGLRANLIPVGVQEGHGLVSEGLGGDAVEESERLRVELLGEGLRVGGGALLVELSGISGRHGGVGMCASGR